jgi:cytochrome c peroxidase
LFADQCEGCHTARASADEPDSRQPFERWESLVFSLQQPLVWGSDGYQRTGVEPYVHEQGARTPSLRRSYLKRPYFTNGSAPDLSSVVEFIRLQPFSHQRGEGPTLDAEQRAALVSFLRLL